VSVQLNLSISILSTNQAAAAAALCLSAAMVPLLCVVHRCKIHHNAYTVYCRPDVSELVRRVVLFLQGDSSQGKDMTGLSTDAPPVNCTIVSQTVNYRCCISSGLSIGEPHVTAH
jgi:hypothetical protein